MSHDKSVTRRNQILGARFEYNYRDETMEYQWKTNIEFTLNTKFTENLYKMYSPVLQLVEFNNYC